MWPRRGAPQIPATGPEVSLLVGQTGLCGTPRGRMYRHRRAYLERSCWVKINHPGHLVARNQRLPESKDARSAILVVVQIRPADPDVAHSEPNLIGSWI